MPAGFAQYKFTDGADQAGLFGKDNKVAWRHITQLRVIPAHQRFGGVQTPCGQAQLGLIEHVELAFANGFAQLVFQLQPFKGAAMQAVTVELKPAAAQVLGLLHGLVGMMDQAGNIARAVGQHADAH